MLRQVEDRILEEMLKKQGLLSVKKRRLSWGKGGHNNKFSTLTMQWAVTDKIVILFLEVHNKRMNENGHKLQCGKLIKYQGGKKTNVKHWNGLPSMTGSSILADTKKSTEQVSKQPDVTLKLALSRSLNQMTFRGSLENRPCYDYVIPSDNLTSICWVIVTSSTLVN